MGCGCDALAASGEAGEGGGSAAGKVIPPKRLVSLAALSPAAAAAAPSRGNSGAGGRGSVGAGNAASAAATTTPGAEAETAAAAVMARVVTAARLPAAVGCAPPRSRNRPGGGGGSGGVTRGRGRHDGRLRRVGGGGRAGSDGHNNGQPPDGGGHAWRGGGFGRTQRWRRGAGNGAGCQGVAGLADGAKPAAVRFQVVAGGAGGTSGGGGVCNFGGGGSFLADLPASVLGLGGASRSPWACPAIPGGHVAVSPRRAPPRTSRWRTMGAAEKCSTAWSSPRVRVRECWLGTQRAGVPLGEGGRVRPGPWGRPHRATARG